VVQGRRKDQHNDPINQAEAKDNVDHRMRQRSAGHEEIAGRDNYYANIETGALGSNGTIAGVGIRSLGTSRGSQGTDSTDLGRVHGIDQ
jgi:hypothetical protein